MALAAQNYHDTHAVFPPGHIIPGNRSGANGHKTIAPWQVLILPYVEQKALYDIYDFNVFSDDDGKGGANKTVRQTHISIYRCPTDLENDQPGATPGQNRVALNESTGLPESDGGGPAVVFKLPATARDGTLTFEVPAAGTDTANFEF